MKCTLKRFLISVLALCVLSGSAFSQRDDKKKPPPDKDERVWDKKPKEPKKEDPPRDNKDRGNDNRKKPDN